MKASVYPLKGHAAPFFCLEKTVFFKLYSFEPPRSEAGSLGDNPPKQVWAAAQYHPFLKKRSFRADCEAVYD